METCGECHALYSAQLWTEQQGPDAESLRRTRLERSLFGPAVVEQASGTIGRRGWVLTGAASACVILLVSLVRFWPGASFQEKGASLNELSRHVSVTAYKRTASGEFTPVAGTIQSSDQLAFAYSNMSDMGLNHLLLFGVDEIGTIYWYYPAWTDPARNPSALPIRRGTGVELPEQVGHQYRGEQLRIFALFSSRGEHTVRDIEGIVLALRRRGVNMLDLERFPLADSGQQSFLLKVVRP